MTGVSNTALRNNIKLETQLEIVRRAIEDEEQNMKELVKAFHESSEVYNKLRIKQRSLMVKMYTTTKEVASK